MSEPLWRRATCQKCKNSNPCMILGLWGLDKDGVLVFMGACRWCLNPMEIRHDFDEMRADVREAWNNWIEEQSDVMSLDFLIWENQLLENRELKGDDDEC